MKLEQLLEAAPRKIAAQERRDSRSALEKEIEKVFKLYTTTTEDPFNGKVFLRMKVPADMEPDDIEFTVKMLVKKLPAMFKKYRDTPNITIGEPRITMPSMKSMRVSSGVVHTMSKGEKSLSITVIEA